MKNSLRLAYDHLIATLGPQGWWPGETALEVMVGAVLTQNTAWTNVEKAIENLREVDALQVSTLATMPHEELSELIRPAGYYRLKAKRLQNLVNVIAQDFEGDVQQMFGLGKSGLRQRLLEINGIGPETADSIVLYAAQLPIFVVDAYTARIVKRHGWIEPEADYHDLQQAFHDALPEDTQLFNEYHALIVRVGKQFCRKTPKCDDCPLVELLPSQGPLSLDA